MRKIQVSGVINDYVKFPYCGQVFRIIRERTVIKTGKFERETVYGITSLTAEKAGPQKLLSLNRGHWSIENCSHWVRDWNYDEDRAQIREGSGPRMMACLRNFAVGLLRLAKYSKIAPALREFAAKPHLALKLLGL